MRKMLMRMCLGVSPGGPCALEFKIATDGISTETTAGTESGIAQFPDSLDASISLSVIALAVIRVCIVQCEHNSTGWPSATALGSGLEADSSTESIGMLPMLSWDIADPVWCVSQETCADRRCGQRAAIRKLPP